MTDVGSNSAIEIGSATRDDLSALLSLYRFLNQDDPVLAADGALQDHWEALEILKDFQKGEGP